ncbi:unnamed protein product [Linum tenue]|uniref:NAC domain-containing protein n=1 Tax=Linum tenue TaxID=586396 RepID=A0AAV0MMS8_9ROSI|nr:unnamed protein product [Linum tenue]
MLPGFRFHPTDEELVGFYLKRKTQLRPLSIDLIKQLDIYKYDPWDLPKMATGSGEKEWYFFCPRDRKYRNSARPNRVTGSGFWKATGTDRPIYSSEGNKYCIGLKKSLVFYKGRAAKGMKTDWMMHEFRLPSLAAAGHHSSKRFVDTTIPPNNIWVQDAWAICRIFKKTSSTAQRALSQSWVSPSLVQEEAALPTSTTPNCFTQSFMSSATTTTTAPSFPPIHRLSFDYNYNDNNYYASPDFYSFKPINNSIIPLAPKPSYHLHTYPYSAAADHESSANFSSPPPTAKCTSDLSSVLLNMPSSSSMLLGNHFKQQAGGGDRESMSSSADQFSNGSHHSNSNGGNIVTSNGGAISSSSLISGSSHDPASIMMSTKSPDLAHIDGLPFSYLGHDGCSTPTTTAAWKQNLLLWDYANYSSPTFPGSSDQVATTFSTTKCYN